MTVNFNEVSLSATKSGSCAVCGKHAKRSEKFSQTLNPFNKNADGSLKNSDQINTELLATVNEWKQKAIRHAKCEYLG
jgi:hypothetical protein